MNALEAEVLRRVRADGPVRLHVTGEEYVWLRRAVRTLWDDHDGWWARQEKFQLLFLAFLRAYTFYRDLSENDRVFWANFYRELELPPRPVTNAQYDNLWAVLTSHEETRPYCRETSGGRRFVDSIAAIWGIRSLTAAQLISFFGAYYNRFPGRPIDRALMQRLVPDADDVMLRQAAAYDRVFRDMTRVVDFILDTNKNLARLAPDVLCARLEAAGVSLGTPNPVKFFAHKTEAGLWRLVTASDGGTRRRYRVHVARTTLRQPTDESDVTVQLAPGVGVEGGGVEVRLEDREQFRSGRAELRFEHVRVPVHGALVRVSGLSVGRHVGELYLNDQPAGRSVDVTILPAFEWQWTRQRGPLIERQWQVGSVRLHDGRFGTFRWQPSWECEDGRWRPGGSVARVWIDEALEFDVLVSAESYGARVLDPSDGSVVSRVSSPEVLRRAIVRVFTPSKRRPQDVRAYVESVPDVRCSVLEGQHVAPLADVTACSNDAVVLEVRHADVWHRLHAVPYDAPPLSWACEVRDGDLMIDVGAARNVRVRVEERARSGTCVEAYELLVPSGAFRHELRRSTVWEALDVTVSVVAENEAVVSKRVSCPPRPLVDAWSDLLRHGLGWAALKRKQP
ncbi:hypothetical protein [Deinococcus yavapaiensis]|uniref:Uncharacterized protein n=1 Tax=Deinococcus yavapaiensis KR-236 TaxID=694435 RepID=A0A318S297_9DEIO|nr:hypothetical protein [Deinococcus yavapaiensis]PYE52046.1 hypothetical protein DES52_11392 [Deinococcus yavapaiensis KR-236]